MDKQPRERLRVEEPLVADIVHRQHRAHRAEPRVPLPLKLVDGDGEGRLPVVAVQHVRRPSAREQLQHRAPEEREPVGVVRVLRSGRPIQTLAVEVTGSRERRRRAYRHRPPPRARPLARIRPRPARRSSSPSARRRRGAGRPGRRGRTRLTSTPWRVRDADSAPTMSARPPVFAKGVASELTIAMRGAMTPPVVRSLAAGCGRSCNRIGPPRRPGHRHDDLDIHRRRAGRAVRARGASAARAGARPRLSVRDAHRGGHRADPRPSWCGRRAAARTSCRGRLSRPLRSAASRP